MTDPLAEALDAVLPDIGLGWCEESLHDDDIVAVRAALAEQGYVIVNAEMLAAALRDPAEAGRRPLRTR